MATSSPKPSLAILDDYANLSRPFFEPLAPRLSRIEYFPSTLPPSNLEALISRLASFEIICTMRERTPFPATLLAHLPNLRLLLTTGIRNQSLDLPYARDHHILVAGAKGERPSSDSETTELLQHVATLPPPPGSNNVNQHAWALLLALCSQIPRDDRALRSDPGAWQGSPGLISLAGKTLGVVGLGKLGRLFAAVAQRVWGMRVLAWSANLTQATADAAAQEAGFAAGDWEVVAKDRLFRDADVVSLHNVLSDRSRGLVGRAELEMMKPEAVLLNTSRGALVEEEALIAVLQAGGIAGVAMDVFWEEPLGEDSVWRKVDDWVSPRSSVVMSPHMGYVHAGTMGRWYQEQAQNVQRWLAGDDVKDRMN